MARRVVSLPPRKPREEMNSTCPHASIRRLPPRWLGSGTGMGLCHNFKTVDFRPPVSDYQLCLLQCKGEAQMILKVTVLKNGVDVFTAHIDVGQPSELST